MPKQSENLLITLDLSLNLILDLRPHQGKLLTRSLTAQILAYFEKLSSRIVDFADT
jgi:hypothetical protein